MRTRFENWLTKPTTLCFLRRLLAAVDRPHGASPNATAREGTHRRYISLTVRSHHENRSGLGETERFYAIHPKARVVVRPQSAEARHRGNSVMGFHTLSARHSHTFLNEKTGTDDQISAPLYAANNDGPGSSQNLDRAGPPDAGIFWIEMIAKHARLHGFEGIRKIWNETRRDDVALPTQGPEADAVWTTLLSYCISEENTQEQDLLLQDIILYARGQKQGSGTQWSGLYHYVIGRWLRVRPDSALHWHERLTRDLEILPIDLNPLAEDCARSPNLEKTRLAFRDIYARSPPQRVYDAFVSTLLQHKHPKKAVQLWHDLFIECDDTPISPAAHSLYKELSHCRSDEASSFSQQVDILKRQPLPTLTRASMSTLVGEVHGIKPKKLTDTFVAKWLATQAFTLDIVMAGLEFLAIEILGPLALRQLAMRAGSCAELDRRFGELKRRGICLPKSIYASLLETLVAEGQDGLLRTLLSSDQHPETFEDCEIQTALLHQHLRAGDENMVHLTVLALSHVSADASLSAWNSIFKFRLSNRDHLAVKSVAAEMQGRGIAISQDTICRLFEIYLPSRRPGRRPSDINIGAGVDPENLTFVTRLLIYTAKKGQHPTTAQWVEILKRHGMTGNWTGVHRLTLWLANFYKFDQSHRSVLGDVGKADKPIIHRIFKRKMIEAIVHWGFKIEFTSRRSMKPSQNGETSPSMPWSSIPVRPSWAKGIGLAYLLMTRFGLGSISHIRRALKTRLWILFGPGYSNNASNLAIRIWNRRPLRHYVRVSNRICDGELFTVSPELLRDDPAQTAALLLAVFGDTPSTNIHTNERADVKVWAADQYWHTTSEPRMSGDAFRQTPPGRIIMERRRAWHSSPYRLRRQKQRAITLAS